MIVAFFVDQWLTTDLYGADAVRAAVARRLARAPDADPPASVVRRIATPLVVVAGDLLVLDAPQ
jgi:hypothetical protein